ncbi:MAG TPA: non-heme iron oxygenase ferredoxin subunit [Thermoanaerobaculia bacterium]|nr:non-heme iron oxygenase ferredoxin subunit [Thermoanaerobaculia bacterium]HUM28817.1 non-heme iron oxygenase ferredoxin subunit [Thermoanaerobaculia bacterium]HXK69074.1 non-heme iron oxygenase ferredoxin subunit [Thermoanaerobaculia bacterium]
MKHKVCSITDVPPGSKHRFQVDGEPVLIANIEGTFYAVSDTCSHADASLADGIMEGTEVECPYHGARFDIRTGNALSLPAVSPIESFTVSVEGDEIYIESDFF